MIGRQWKVFGLIGLSCLFAGAGIANGEPVPLIEDSLGAPFRVRD